MDLSDLLCIPIGILWAVCFAFGFNMIVPAVLTFVCMFIDFCSLWEEKG